MGDMPMAIIFAVGLITSGLHFFLLQELYLSFLVLLVQWMIYWWILHAWKIHQTRNETFHTMYYFLHQMIMSLSLKGNLYEAYVDTKNQLKGSFQKQLLERETPHILMTLEQLTELFPFTIYRIGLKTFHFYDEKGGDVLSLFDAFLKQLRLEEVRLLDKKQLFDKYSIQFFILWGLNIGIILFARFVLNTLFLQMASGMLFQLTLTGFFLYIPLSSWMWMKGIV
jgi:hypothetical protein